MVHISFIDNRKVEITQAPIKGERINKLYIEYKNNCVYSHNEILLCNTMNVHSTNVSFSNMEEKNFLIMLSKRNHKQKVYTVCKVYNNSN